ncbi:MAG: DNA polymerase III subunit epsilon [Deltaproteobacteria bacterium]|nr:DNA polymerase III subunit epsilon [Deltaproteobacteria bacterium]HCH65724.1 DNA polymerase III subunit epsilon [Deltaproteobacteria bacterium]
MSPALFSKVHREHRATYFCVDIECNGPVPGLFAMVSLAAVVVAPDADGRLHVGECLYLELKPDAPRHDARAASIHGLDQARLMREGLDRPAFCTQLSDWVKAHTVPGTEPVFVGHNAPFDWSFVAWTFSEVHRPNPFGYKALCTKAMATGVLGVHWLDSNKEVLSERLPITDEDLSQKHRADYDALYQAEILVALLDRQAQNAGTG